MKLRILSDLHVEFFPCEVPAAAADAVILAGDIGSGFLGLQWAAKAFDARKQPVVYVPGNHEFYGYDMDFWGEQAMKLAQDTGIHLCNPGSVLLEKDGEPPVRVLGVTLWTDFAVFGEGRKVVCAQQTQRALADYRAIQIQGRLLHWTDTEAMHQRAMAWLRTECLKAKEAGEKVVVVTHHTPSLKSSLPRFMHDPVTAGFASNLERFLDEHVSCWFHGHVHNSSSYPVGRGRVVANPRGYPQQRWNPQTTFENPNFNPALVIEV